ncbi:mannosyltransferase putative-domain-containing protein [Gorgonomyces haynaldii]|nr:mannosyltransferase putative-domain-containing protein [Gorgonomyces haynaldii]
MSIGKKRSLVVGILFVFLVGANLNLFIDFKRHHATSFEEQELECAPKVVEVVKEVSVIQESVCLAAENELPLSDEEILQIDVMDLKKCARVLREYKQHWNRVMQHDYDGVPFDSLVRPQHLVSSMTRMKTIERSRLLNWNQDAVSMYELYMSFKGRGLVIPASNYDIPLAMSSILSIRNIHKSKIPIEVVYNGAHELDQKVIEKLEAIPGVTVKNLQNVFPDTKVTFSGWSVKAAALLVASCAECILMDADAIFMKPPELAFEQERYLRSRMLLFKDRTVYINTDGQWVKDIIPKEAHEKLDGYRLFQSKSFYEAEAGVVVVDKKQRFLGLLGVTFLNTNPVVQQSYKGFHGDKETFWVGMEMMQEKYSFDVHLPTAIGNYDEARDKDKLCTVQIAHQDENGDLFWFNGGVIEDKLNIMTSNFVKFTHWSPELLGYEFTSKRNFVCSLMGENSPVPLTLEQLDFFTKLDRLWEQIKTK